MLNHISVRQIETSDNRERLNKLSTKIDQILTQQSNLLGFLGAPVPQPLTAKDSLSGNVINDVTSTYFANDVMSDK